MNRTILIVLAVGLIAAAISFFTFVDPHPVPSTRFRLKPDPDTILFAVTPWGEAKKMKEGYAPLLKYLSKATDKKFQLLIMEDYETAIHQVADGDIDIAILPPVSYILSRQREPAIQYVATQLMERNGKSFATYKAYLVTLSSKYPDWSLEIFLEKAGDLKFGFVTQSSSSGYIYPMSFFKKRGIDPRQIFQKIIFFENHSDLTDALIKGDIDLGATWEHNLNEAKQKHGDRFSIVATTGEIPGITWIASKKVDPQFVQKVRGVLLSLSKNRKIKEILSKTPEKGWTTVSETFYNQVRENIKYVESAKD